MNPSRWIETVRLLLRQLKWQLTLTYVLVSLTAVIIAAWWATIAIALYLGQTSPDLSWQEAIGTLMLPVVGDILPSAPLLLLPAVLVSTYFGFLSARWLDARLTRLRQATTAWQQGDFSVRVQDEAADEIGRFGAELNEMAAELHNLLQAQQELATLQERHRLARDLHDSVKQHLAAASLQIGAAQALLNQNPTAAEASLVEAAELTHLAKQELSAIIFELQPDTLNRHGLANALRHYVVGWSRQAGIAVELVIEEKWPLPTATENALFRFGQEALSNVARHSQASLVQVSLLFDSAQCQFIIQDNGRGFDPLAAPKRGRGLTNMRERIAELGGQTLIETAPDQGTTISVRLPLPGEKQNG
jgi:two-component system, NarL family, sensor histidine kinase LiaS